MKGKIVFVVGLAAGYVLGARAGRERYEQIREGWLTVWNTEPIQKKVESVQGFTKARIGEVPGIIGRGIGGAITKLAGGGSTSAVEKRIDSVKRKVNKATTSAAKAAKDVVKEAEEASSEGKSSSGAQSSKDASKD